MSSDEWESILDVVRNRSAEAVKQLGCPNCGGPVSIAYTVSGKRKSPGLGVTCRNLKCLANVRVSGVVSQPPWVEEIGYKLVTDPEQPMSISQEGMDNT